MEERRAIFGRETSRRNDVRATQPSVSDKKPISREELGEQKNEAEDIGYLSASGNCTERTEEP